MLQFSRSLAEKELSRGNVSLVHWGLDRDQRGGPSEVEGEGDSPPWEEVWNACATSCPCG